MNFDDQILKWVYSLHGYGIIFYVLLTAALSAVLSFAVAMERQLRGKSISIKTHVLLSVGCSLLMTISIWAIRIADGSIDIMSGPASISRELSYDTSRIAAAVVTGMGFLGAGAIIKDKFTVRGLSTAATLWISAAIGLACGSGFILESVALTALVILILIAVNAANKFMIRKSPCVTVSVTNDFPLIKTVNDIALENNLTVRDIDIISVEETMTTARIILPYHFSKTKTEYFKNQLRRIDGIIVENKKVRKTV
ncbi:MAG: MgtC/SapB family protein [Clostridia bacterium]|nr:MgtC/SapB family protein [Clostridia bacterium]